MSMFQIHHYSARISSIGLRRFTTAVPRIHRIPTTRTIPFLRARRPITPAFTQNSPIPSSKLFISTSTILQTSATAINSSSSSSWRSRFNNYFTNRFRLLEKIIEFLGFTAYTGIIILLIQNYIIEINWVCIITYV